MPLLPIPSGVPSPLVLQTYTGAPGGMSRSAPQHELPDIQAWTIADAVLEDPGFIRRRGPLTDITGTSNGGKWPLGIAAVQDPAGVEQVAVLARTTAPGGQLYGIKNTNSLQVTWPYTPSASGPSELVCVADALDGGVLIGSASGYDQPANKAIRYWRGASTNDRASVTLSASVTRGDGTVGVTANTGLSVGMFIFKSGQLLGTVKSINGTTLTLMHPALISAAGTVDFTATRGLTTRVATGRITCSTADTTFTVNGGATKFSSQGLATGTWDIFTSDYVFVGTVATVTSDIQLVLTAAPAVSLTNGGYVAIQRDATFGTPFGWLSCSFAGLQFYADGNVLRFSSELDREAVDTTVDGDYLTFSADPIRAIQATTTELVVLTENDAFSIVGAVGTTPDRWRGTPIISDGTISGMTAMAYKGGVIWAGKTGVWYYAGTSPTNIVQNLSNDYRKFVTGFSNTTNSAYGGLVNDHYLLFMDGGTANVFQKIKGSTVTDLARPTFLVSLNTGAISILQNVEIRGSTTAAAKLNTNATALMPIQTLEGGVNNGRVLNADALFTTSGQDPWVCNGGAGAGPDLFVETKKYDVGDAQRLKLFRMLLMHHLAVGGNVCFDYVAGLTNTAGTTPTDQFRANTDWTDQRIKFNRKTQVIAFRIYQSTISGDPTVGSPPAANITNLVLASWAIAYKVKRPGRT